MTPGCRIGGRLVSSVVLTCVAAVTIGTPVFGQSIVNRKVSAPDAFRQLEEVLPTPNAQRTAAGAPGPEYWQQKVDYEIDVTLDDEKQRLIGDELITYTNNSPDTLPYLWLQLDANRFRPDSNSNLHQTAPSMSGRRSYDSLEGQLYARSFPGGFQIRRVTDAESGRNLSHSVIRTNMRVQLAEPLRPGESCSFRVAWDYNIPDSTLMKTRGGFEYFEKDGNYIYEMAQWFPRLCAYTDTTGWQHKEFLGRGEFTLEFGDYLVRITAPSDHIVAATGRLVNSDAVLTADQAQRFQEAASAEKPVFVVTPEEAKANESSKPEATKTWIFKADNVRDFAFASSRKFIWDAWGHRVGDRTVMAMSFYPNEAEPLWSRYSTHAIVHTIEVYSKFTFDYPYPTAISVNGPVYGMEYPMICFNGPRPEEDGTYSARTKYGLISVVIHEVGHNYFPMIVNSDERQWTWMDEGLNTFLQFLAEVEWQDEYPSRRGEPKDIVSYMAGTQQVPIMTNSESLLQFGPNAYSKPATALNILRETILGREQFDFAFRQYSQNWMFRRPYPADFFRTMEDASGTDLDWFWRGWFYSTDHVDLAISSVEEFTVDRGNPKENADRRRAERESEPPSLTRERSAGIPKRVARYPELADFYNEYDDLDVSAADQKRYGDSVKKLTDTQRRLLNNRSRFYVVGIDNVGGLVMPVLLKLTHADGTTREVRLPAEIWTRNAQKTSRLIVSRKEVTSIEIDPYLETADTNRDNNYFPPRMKKSRFQLYKESKSRNEMQRRQAEEEAAKKEQARRRAAAAEKRKKQQEEEAAAQESP